MAGLSKSAIFAKRDSICFACALASSAWTSGSGQFGDVQVWVRVFWCLFGRHFVVDTLELDVARMQRHAAPCQPLIAPDDNVGAVEVPELSDSNESLQRHRAKLPPAGVTLIECCRASANVERKRNGKRNIVGYIQH